ncbi:hypothetical protein B0H14DRAFT_3422004 [Mycena olivaceomarginata]|nr:hypothetical protein B0H14DRAFT_3422004 [Mycena olivaceomarginata]
MTSRIVSVFGATGLQGGAVVDALLKDGTSLQEIESAGVEVVKGDPLDRTGLVSALHGSEAVFAVTVPVFFYPNMEGKGELVQGKNIVDAAKEVGVNSSFGGSSLPSLAKISGGKYKNVVHYEEKEAVREHLESSGLTHASLLLPGFLENLHSRPLVTKTDNGYDIALPILKAIDLHSHTWVARDKINGKTYPVVSATISGARLAELAGQALGATVTFTTLPPMGLPPMDEMFLAHAEYVGSTARPVPNPELVALGVKFSTVEEFMETELKPRFVQ